MDVMGCNEVGGEYLEGLNTLDTLLEGLLLDNEVGSTELVEC
jgi:hypothetical protein